VEGLERPRLIEMMVAVIISEERADVVRAEAAVAAGSDLEDTGDASDTERTTVAEMSLEERQLMWKEREIEERRQARLLEEIKLEKEMMLEEKRLQQERIIKEKEMELQERKLEQERMLKEKEIE